MKKSISIIICLVSFITSVKSQSGKNIWTIGPTLNYNICSKSFLSYGLEVAIWKNAESIDFGLETSEGTRFWLYSEYQVGHIYYGASLGPCLEFRVDSIKYIKPGLQITTWANVFVGADLRFRINTNDVYFCPGGYVKLVNNIPRITY